MFSASIKSGSERFKPVMWFLVLMFIFGCNENKVETGSNIVFRIAIQPDPTNKAWDAANLFRQEIETRSDGKIKVMFYDTGILGAERQILESCYFGIIEMVQVTSSVVSTVDPLYNALDMPYLFYNEEHHQKILNGPLGEELLDDLNKYGFKGIAFYSCGFRHFFNSKKPLNTPSDLRGLKIRVMESPMMMASVSAMGASPTPLSASELYSSIKTGVVDGAENNPQVFVSQHYDDVCKYFSLTGHFANQHVLIANAKWFQSLSPESRKLIENCAKDIIPAYNEIWNEAVEKAMKEMESRGVKVNKIDDINPFIESVETVYKKYSNIVPESLVKKISEETVK